MVRFLLGGSSLSVFFNASGTRVAFLVKTLYLITFPAPDLKGCQQLCSAARAWVRMGEERRGEGRRGEERKGALASPRAFQLIWGVSKGPWCHQPTRARSATVSITSLAPEPGARIHIGDRFPLGALSARHGGSKELLAKSFWQGESSQPWSSQRNQGAARSNYAIIARLQWGQSPESSAERGQRELAVLRRFGHALQQDWELATTSKQICSVARACLELFKKQPDSLWQGCSKTWNASLPQDPKDSQQLCSAARACLELFKKQPDSVWQGL